MKPPLLRELRPAMTRLCCPSPSARPIFLTAARGEFDPIDDNTLMRARGWALALGLAYLANSLDDEAMAALGRATIDSALRITHE